MNQSLVLVWLEYRDAGFLVELREYRLPIRRVELVLLDELARRLNQKCHLALVEVLDLPHTSGDPLFINLTSPIFTSFN